MTLINLRGIRATAKANFVLMIAMMVVILAFMGLAVHWLFHAQGWAWNLLHPPLLRPGDVSLEKHHDRHLTGGPDVWRVRWGKYAFGRRQKSAPEHFVGYGVRLLLYRHFRRAAGLSGTANLAWHGQLVELGDSIHRYQPHRGWSGPVRRDGCHSHHCQCCLWFNRNGRRLPALFGMGRDKVLPQSVFGYFDKKHSTPVYNILLVGVFVYIGSLFLNFERAAELINFGAFIAFMGVNAAVIRQFYFLRSRAERNLLTDAVLPCFGLLFCLAIWLSLPIQAKVLGCVWFVLGLIWSAIQTRGFRIPPLMVSFEEV